MNCDLCGSESELVRAVVEGTELNVCSKCGRYGRILGKMSVAPPKPKPVERNESMQIINPQFAKIVKQSRESLNMKQEDLAKALNEKESLIQKIETGVVIPNIALAKKFESFLKITLIEEYRDDAPQQQKTKSAELTLGDFVKIKKK